MRGSSLAEGKEAGESTRTTRILFLFGIYHPATAPVYALLGRACVCEDKWRRGKRPRAQRPRAFQRS